MWNFFSCRCTPGWQGIHCTQRTVDCLASSSHDLCGHGTCVHTNDPRSYRCICDQGWKTDGVSPACMVDINECELSMPHCSVEPQVLCINLPGFAAIFQSSRILNCKTYKEILILTSRNLYLRSLSTWYDAQF